MRHEPSGFRNLADDSLLASLPDRRGGPVEALAGIARPQAFFAALEKMGMAIRPRAFPDHHLFSPADIDPQARVVMTEKDAVKCKASAGPDWWALELRLVPSADLEAWLAQQLARDQ